MTVGITAAVLNGWLNALCRGSDYTAPAEFWIKLHTGDPGAAGTAHAATETTRQQASFAAATGGTITTNADLIWTGVSTSETYSHWSAWTASSGGTFLASDNLTIPRAVTAGADFTIPSGSLDIAITPVAS